MANPYGIEQVDVPGILSAFTTARTQRTQQLLTERAMAREDAQLERETKLRTAYAKLQIPGAGGGAASAVSAYGAKDAPAPGPVVPSDFGQTAGATGPAAVATPAVGPVGAPAATGAPAAPGAAPDGAPHPLQGWLDTNSGAIQDIMRQDPQSGLQIMQHFHQLDAEKQQAIAQHLEFADHANQIGLKLILTAKDQPTWDAARQSYTSFLQQYGLPVPDLKKEYDPQYLHGLLEQAQTVQQHLEAMKPVVLGEGAKLVSPMDGSTIAENEKATKYQPVTIHNADGSSRAVVFNPDKGVFEDAPAGAGGGADTTGAVVGGKLDPKAFFTQFVSPHEGGYAAHDANGAPVNHGINQSANPGVDVKNLSADQAAQIFADKYFKASGAANLPPALAAVVADTAFINPARAKQFLAQAGSDPGKFMDLREAWMANLVKGDPGKYGKYEKTWANRNRDLRTYSASLGGDAPAAAGGTRSVSGASAPHDAGDDETAKFIGGQVALGQPMPPLGMGKEAAAMRRSILAEATKQWRAMGISPGEANVIAAQNKSGLAELAKIAAIKANVQTAENTANSNASQVLSLLGSAGTTGSPIFNSWQQAGRRATGDAKVSAFDVAVKTLATEYARVMTGGGNAPLSDSARHEADALLHTSMTPAQFQATIKQMKVDMANRTAGIEQERQATLSQIRTGGQGGPSGVAHVASDADYAKLPHGAHFIDPHGQHRIKP